MAIRWADDQAVEEARAKIAAEFMSKYREWFDDYHSMQEREYANKYGYGRNPELEVKDNLKAVTMFQKYIFAGRWLPEWEKAGYSKYVLWDLIHAGFLSEQEYSNWNARATGRTNFYYISQRMAKEIYKASK